MADIRGDDDVDTSIWEYSRVDPLAPSRPIALSCYKQTLFVVRIGKVFARDLCSAVFL